MQLRKLSISIAIVSLSATPVIAGPKAPAPKSPATTATHGSPKTLTVSAPQTHGSAKTTTTSSSTPKTHGKTATTTSSSTATTGSTGSTTSGSTTTSGGTTGGTTTTGAPVNPIAQKIASKPQLASKVKTLLPAGMTLDQASKGFKNQGQFIAALHVSQNLHIPFADLKTAMTGIRPSTTTTTGTKTGSTSSSTTSSGTTTSGTTSGTSTTTDGTRLLSLGQAIKKLRPTADADAATTTATKQATTDLGSK